MAYYSKPETALRRAQDLARLGESQYETALHCLHPMLTSRRFRAWSPVHENIILLYIDLCVPLRKNAKEGLHQYKLICQHAQQSSFEKAIDHLLKCASAKGEEALAELAKEELKDDDEARMQKERSYRQFSSPWLRYQWECYRNTLEVLRNNNKFLPKYHHVVSQAITFCRSLDRTSEFRRLCEVLRTHIRSVERSQGQGQTNQIILSDPDVVHLMLRTDFRLIRAAAALEMWQEAYRIVEDIHNVMDVSKAPLPSAMLLTYYEKLAQIFWQAKNSLFHAYALERLYQLASDVKGVPAEVLQRLSTTVVLSTLSIYPEPPISTHVPMHVNRRLKKNYQIAMLLGFDGLPSRRVLMQRIRQNGHLSGNPALQRLVDLVESDAVKGEPFSLSKKTVAVLDEVLATVKDAPVADSNDESLAAILSSPLKTASVYREHVMRLCVLRMVECLATLYNKVSMKMFDSICPADLSFENVEPFLMRLVRDGVLPQFRVDYRCKSIMFSSEDAHARLVREQLCTLAKKLVVVTDTLRPELTKEKDEQRTRVFAAVSEGVQGDHEQVAARMELIERRKEYLEETAREHKESTFKRQAHERNAFKQREQERLHKEREMREKKREEDEQRRHQERANQVLVEQLKLKNAWAKKQASSVAENAKSAGSATSIASIVAAASAASAPPVAAAKATTVVGMGTGDSAIGAGAKGKLTEAEKKLASLLKEKELHEVSKKDILNMQTELLRKQKEALRKKLSEEKRRVFFLERAMRLEETPLLDEDYKTRSAQGMEDFRANLSNLKKTHKEQHKKNLMAKKRMSRMEDNVAAFREKMLTDRRAMFERQQEDQLRRKQEHEDRREEIREKLRLHREQQRVADEQRKKEEEERIAQLEHVREQRMLREREEEEECIAQLEHVREQRAQKEKEEAEERERVAERIRQKEADMQTREQERPASRESGVAGESARPRFVNARAGGGWRSRQQAAADTTASDGRAPEEEERSSYRPPQRDEERSSNHPPMRDVDRSSNRPPSHEEERYSSRPPMRDDNRPPSRESAPETSEGPPRRRFINSTKKGGSWRDRR